MQPFGLPEGLFLPGLLARIRTHIKFGIGKDKAHAPTGNRGGLKVCGFKGKGSGEGGAVAAHPESMNSKQTHAKRRRVFFPQRGTL